MLPTRGAVGAAARLDFHVGHGTAAQIPLGLQLQGCRPATVAPAATGIFLMQAVRQNYRGAIQKGHAGKTFEQRRQRLV